MTPGVKHPGQPSVPHTRGAARWAGCSAASSFAAGEARYGSGIGPLSRPVLRLRRQFAPAFAGDGRSQEDLVTLTNVLSETHRRCRRRHPAGLSLVVATLLALVAVGWTAGAPAPLAAPRQLAPLAPRIIGHLGGWTSAVDVEGTLAYVAVGSRLRIVDIADPRRPRILSESAELPALINELSVAGGMVYIADRAFGLRVVDARDPASPVVIGAGEKMKGAKAVRVAAGHAYVADGAVGVHVLDVADPRAPREAALIPVDGGEAWDLKLVGDRAYIADRIGLRVVDVSRPGAPTLIGRRETPGWARDVAVSGRHAFVADGDRGLVVLDLVDPADISRVADLDTPGEAWAVEISGNRAYLADGDSLRIIDITDAEDPQSLGSLPIAGEARDLQVQGDTVFVAGGSTGLHIVDVADGRAPRELAALADMPVQANAAAADLDRLFVADSAYGLRVFDVKVPAAPRLLGGLDTPGTAVELRHDRGRVWLADRAAGLAVIDVSDPSRPLLAGRWDIAPRRVMDLDIDAKGAAVLEAPADGGRHGLRLLDTTGAAPPRETGSLATLRLGYDLQLVGDRAFVADLDGLRVFDVRDRSAPRELGQADPIGVVYGVAAAGDIVYATIGESGLRVLDGSDPERRRVIGAVDTDGYFRDLQRVGDLLYVADKDFGLRVFDLRDPAAPREVAAQAVTGGVEHVTVVGDTAYLSLGTAGLAIVQLRAATPTATPTRAPETPATQPSWRLLLPWLADGQ